jgi:hypothetical protein
VDTSARKHPPAPKYAQKENDGITYLVMGNPNWCKDEVLDSQFARAIIDEAMS